MNSNEFNDMEKDNLEQDTKVSGKKKIEYDESLFENSTVFGASTVKNKKRMLKPITKGLILSAVAIAVAGTILAITLKVPQTSDEQSTMSIASTPTYVVTSIAESSVERVTVMNSYHPEGYDVYKVYDTETTDSSSDASSDGVNYTWRIEGYEKYDLTGVKYLVQAALAITSNKKYDGLDSTKADDYELGDFKFEPVESDETSSEDASSLDAVSSDVTSQTTAESNQSANIYGFDTPYSVISISQDSGTFKIVVGSTAPDKSGRYVTVTGDESIYIVAETSMSYFGSDFTDMVGLLAVNYMAQDEQNSEYYSENSIVKIDSVKLGGTCRKNNVTIESPPDDLSALMYVATSPAFRACDEEKVNDILSVATSGLANSGSFCLGYDDETLKQYGLDNPYSTVEINIGTYRVSMIFGKAIDGYYPCLVSGKDIIYRVPVPDGTEENPNWIAYKDTDIYYESLFLEYITGISSIKVEFSDKQATFNLNHFEDDDGTKTFSVNCAEAVNSVIEKKQLSFYYGRILNLTALSSTEDPIPDGDAHLTITISYTDSSRSSDVIKLYKHSAQRYRYTLNSNGNSLVSARKVDDLYDRLIDLLSGVEIKRGT